MAQKNVKKPKKTRKRRKPTKKELSEKQQKIEKRQRQVFELLQQGMTQESMAVQLDIDRRTIVRDLKAIRNARAKEYQDLLSWDLMSDFNEQQRLRISRLWNIIADKGSTSKIIISAMDKLRKEEELAIDKAQKMGIIPKEMSPLVSVEASSDGGDAENKVQINIIAPGANKKLEKKSGH